MKKLLLILCLLVFSISSAQYNILDENFKILKLGVNEMQVDSIIQKKFPAPIYIQTQVWNEEKKKYETCEKKFPKNKHYENSSSNRTSRKE